MRNFCFSGATNVHEDYWRRNISVSLSTRSGTGERQEREQYVTDFVNYWTILQNNFISVATDVKMNMMRDEPSSDTSDLGSEMTRIRNALISDSDDFGPMGGSMQLQTEDQNSMSTGIQKKKTSLFFISHFNIVHQACMIELIPHY